MLLHIQQLGAPGQNGMYSFLNVAACAALLCTSGAWRVELADVLRECRRRERLELDAQAQAIWNAEVNRVFARAPRTATSWRRLRLVQREHPHFVYATWYIHMSRLVRVYNYEVEAAGLPRYRLPRYSVAHTLAWSLRENPPLRHEHFRRALSQRLPALRDEFEFDNACDAEVSTRAPAGGTMADAALQFIMPTLFLVAQLILGDEIISEREREVVDAAVHDLAELAAIPWALRHQTIGVALLTAFDVSDGESEAY